MEAPDAQSDDDEDDRYQEGGAVEEAVAALLPLPSGDDERATAGGVEALARRTATGGVVSGRVAAQGAGGRRSAS
ncbi:hypothetical protein HMPREF1549_02633 [Actinomyces johnsonii F0510]|uniref:Uncharacterized protein n=1 Tax=Actinomyces johnsonii F0510 TaxID=1227262 RepID=U1Q0G9_9ACTO|nr:hypothetical protein HMPREF1549_02633 [Actinomyces johnsonii F0510]